MPTLRQALQTALDENEGAIPFDLFMGLALHHPEDGYYARHISSIGPEGDFTTTPQMGPALGASVATWVKATASKLGWKKIPVIECGPGDGSLAKALLENFGWLARPRIDLHLVETSAPLRAKQKKLLRWHRVRWHPDIATALVACRGRALIYHNEFFDAFPCRVFASSSLGWEEEYLQVRGKVLEETFQTPRRSLPPSTSLDQVWPEGQRIEVFASVREWMHKLATTWEEGAMLTIDYGGTSQSIYHRRPSGTLRAYRDQQRFIGKEILACPGRQDITAEVNFDDLELWAKELGWRLGPNIPLSDFFSVEAPPHLTDREGAGRAFRCLTFSP